MTNLLQKTPLIEVSDKKKIATVNQPLGDLRFRMLVGQTQWQALPKTVQRRFTKRINTGDTTAYTGKITEVRMPVWGRLLAHITRLIGGPLPYDLHAGNAATVTVCEDATSNGQFWTRIYSRSKGFPQVIHSVKRFQGPTGLEEYVGYGIGMALQVSCNATGIHFKSHHYFLQLGPYRIRLPRWLSPGKVTVSHIDQGHGQFIFALQVSHPWLGELIYQEALFTDLYSHNTDD